MARDIRKLKLKCPRCGDTMELYDDEPSWMCRTCGVSCYYEDEYETFNFTNEYGDTMEVDM